MNHFSSDYTKDKHLDKFEDPREAPDYSYVKQLDMLNKLRKSLPEIVILRKRLEMQKAKLLYNIRLLDGQARKALDVETEDLTRLALERKNANLIPIQCLDKQIGELGRV